MRRLLILTALAVALTAPATAAAPRVITLNWEEAARTGGQSVMTFKVDKITFTGTGWRVTGAYTNTSTKTIQSASASPPVRRGVAASVAADCRSAVASCA